MIGASIVIEWILAIEEYRRVCKLGAVIKESTDYMLQSVNHLTLFTERQRLSLGNSMTDPNLDSHFSCTSPPANSCFTDYFLAALCICFAATSHCYCPFAVYLSRTNFMPSTSPCPLACQCITVRRLLLWLYVLLSSQQSSCSDETRYCTL